MVNDKEKEGGSDAVSEIPIGDSEGHVRNDAPTTSPNNDGNNNEESLRTEDSTLSSESATPVTINTNSSRSNSGTSEVSSITTSTVHQLMPPLDNSHVVETNENESENVDVT